MKFHFPSGQALGWELEITWGEEWVVSGCRMFWWLPAGMWGKERFFEIPILDDRIGKWIIGTPFTFSGKGFKVQSGERCMNHYWYLGGILYAWYRISELVWTNGCLFSVKLFIWRLKSQWKSISLLGLMFRLHKNWAVELGYLLNCKGNLSNRYVFGSM